MTKPVAVKKTVKKGNSGHFIGEPGPGRPKGIPNKSTMLAREAIAQLVDGNASRLQAWLDAIANDEKHGPAVAFKLLMDVMEYHIPKLARTEHTGDGGGEIKASLSVTFVKPDQKQP